MSADSPQTATWAPVVCSAAVMQQVDALCLRFEDALRNDEAPSLETFLNEAEETLRPLLFPELLALELWYRFNKKHETVLPQDYTTRFPEHAEILRMIGSDRTD